MMARKTQIVLGLNSGTSADGVDAVACAIEGRGLSMGVRCIGHVSKAYEGALRRRVLGVMAPARTTTEEICRLDVEIGNAFADAAALAVRELGLRRVDLAGMHGQTICHLPPRDNRKTGAAGTMQIGDAAHVALRLGCPVVHHFRQADLAVGGQGAPLVPWTDHVLFHDRRRTRIILNLGGIANLTYLPASGGPGDVRAFDTGPGNMVIDELVRRFTRGRATYDRDGRWAAQGDAPVALLERMMRHPYLRIAPPKSCGREEFGAKWVEELLRWGRGRRFARNDWIAAATEFSAMAIVLGCAMVGGSKRGAAPVSELILCGGGAKNIALAASLQSLLSLTVSTGRSVELSATDDYGINSQAKEGVSFAMLAAACVDRVPANLPRVTGARRSVVLGSICHPGERK